MAPRNKQNPWFEKRNHVRLAKQDVTKAEVDPVGGGGTDNPVTAGLIGEYGITDYTLIDSQHVDVITNQHTPGYLDMTTGHVDDPALTRRLVYDPAINAFRGSNSNTTSRDMETPGTDNTEIETVFQSGAVSHFHVMEFTLPVTDTNTGVGTGSKRNSWQELPYVTTLSQSADSESVNVTGSTGHIGPDGRIRIDYALDEGHAVYGVSRMGGPIGEVISGYKNGVLIAAGTTTHAYQADIGGDGIYQRSVLSLGRNRQNIGIGHHLRAVVYYNRGVTDQEAADISAYLTEKYITNQTP